LAKRLVLLGSTGSIGQNALEIVSDYPDRFRVVLIGCRRGVDLLMTQAERFHPEWVTIDDNVLSRDQERSLQDRGIRIAVGSEEMREVLREIDYDLAVNAIIGSAGLLPTMDVLERGIDVALANKETLVMGGQLVMRAAQKAGVMVWPIDSEHSAIHQCLRGEDPATIAKIILTASGGPFRRDMGVDLTSVSVKDVLNHPTWEMGPKITVDSATLMNKALEVIEAHYLFNISADDIDVWIHPQSVVHSMVEFVDGSIKAQLGTPDMRLPILYALTGGVRFPAGFLHTDLRRMEALEFEEPDHERFPCLNLAYQVLRMGGAAPAVLSSSDEEAVSLFLKGNIGFADIYRLVSAVLNELEVVANPEIKDILQADQWARQRVRQLAGADQTKT
jgi:1-deoxy-D-xylulose-5-phosphate reductoisomerase